MTTPIEANLASQAMIGKPFGRLLVLGIAPKRGQRKFMFCRCECGTELEVREDGIASGHAQSCGCLHREKMLAANVTHGKSRTPEYRIWLGIRQRCENDNNKNFWGYGGRGILVCERWKEFEAFLADMGPRPSKCHGVERENNNLGYSPENCVWATQREQMRNTSASRPLTFGGKSQCTADWAAELGLTVAAISARLRRGWTIDLALSTPVPCKTRMKCQ